MDLMEYQGKDLFRRLGIPTSPQGEVATTSDEARRLAEQEFAREPLAERLRAVLEQAAAS